jgi:hypothetical protein
MPSSIALFGKGVGKETASVAPPQGLLEGQGTARWFPFQRAQAWFAAGDECHDAGGAAEDNHPPSRPRDVDQNAKVARGPAHRHPHERRA